LFSPHLAGFIFRSWLARSLCNSRPPSNVAN